MNRINIIVLLAILFCSPQTTFSQTFTGRIGDYFDVDDNDNDDVIEMMDVPTALASITVEKEREFNFKVWEILRTYERCADLSSMFDNNELYDFISLFRDEEVLVYNDLLGLSEKKRITVAEYVELMSRNAEDAECLLKNVRRGDITENETHLYTKISFDKELSYFNTCGIFLSSYSYYESDHNEVIVVAMDKSTGECRIMEISGGIKSKQKPLATDFFVIKHTSKYDDNLLANGKHLQFDQMQQAFFNDAPILAYDDENVKVSLEHNAECSNLATIKYNPTRLRLKPRFNFSLGKYYSANLYDNELDVSSFGMEYGLDFGYVLPSLKDIKVGIYTGVAYSISNAEVTASDLSFSYGAGENADVDADSYVRHYEFSKIEQKLSTKSIVMPAYFDLEYLVNKHFTLYAQAGAKIYFNMQGTLSDSRAEVRVYGVYPQYDNLFVDAEYLNGFGEKSFGQDDFVEQTSKINKFNYDLFGSLGFKVSLYKDILLDLNASYQAGLGKVFSRQIPTRYQQGHLFYGILPAEYTVDGGEVLRNPMESIDLKRRFWSLNIGLIFKI